MPKIKLPKISAGTIRPIIFIMLVSIALGFWLYTQLIINHVRDFQKSVVDTQKSIYISIINPLSTDNTGIDSDLIQTLVIDSPFPNIFSDLDNNPIQTRWKNVGIAADDTSETSNRKLKRLIEKMDRINPPDSIPNPALIKRVETLTVYELSPSDDIPLLITDLFGKLLYSRNINEDPADLINSNSEEFDPNPIRFEKENEPTLNFYGIGDQRQPIIIIKDDNGPLYWRDVGVAQNDTTLSGKTRLMTMLDYIKRDGIAYSIVTENIPGYEMLLYHYGDPVFLTWIAWLPVVEFLVIFILIAVGFIGFRNITQAEKRSIWVGMAKETAHQLGTPISSIDGWIELLKSERDDKLVDQAVKEIEYDVKRLTRVAARFSNVGSKPELQPMDVSDVIEEVLDYYRTRVPNMGRSVVLKSHYSNLYQVMGNLELLNWVFENLVKNSLASIADNKKGMIQVTGSMSKDFKHVIIDLEDNGKGIASSEQIKVMRPGYTTKKRGWGLGLSLVKRITEEYHSGKIILLESKEGVGSIFRVILPSVKK
ncbi:PAS domain-containing sensor histidine kinase [Candidatus Latescibacterota bacterium]